MRRTRFRSTALSVVAILCAACFLTMSLGAGSRAVAAETWETWPKKAVEPGVEDANGSATAGDAAGKKTAMGLSYGTIGWIALGTAVVIGIAIAAGGGGGGGGGSTTSNH
jgi:hypothetical protein